MDDLAAYDYDLPADLIASRPLPRRDAARLMVVDRRSGGIGHHSVRDLPTLLRAGDCLVLNNTKVVPARLFGERVATGGKWEGLFLTAVTPGVWRLLCQTRGKLARGEQIRVWPAEWMIAREHERSIDGGADHQNESALADRSDGFTLTLLDVDAEGIWTARCDLAGAPSGESFNDLDVLCEFGNIPLPPYLGRKYSDESDATRYQTIFARTPGAVAAPTAGLHFTPAVLAECEAAGIGRAEVTLHVGIGTFRPISVTELKSHQMHSEWCQIDSETADRLQSVRNSRGRVVAVGTTTVRTLETAAGSGRIEPWQGETSLFITPGTHAFRAVDVLMTNFHLPRSTLLVLVSAFAGDELIREAYAEAVREKYRFYSYGDAMLIL